MADTIPQAGGGIGDLISSLSKLAPIFLGGGNKTTTTNTGTTGTVDTDTLNQLKTLLGNAGANAANPTDATSGLVQSILTQAAQTFAPTAIQQNSSGMYNTTTLNQMRMNAIGAATAQSTQAVLNFQSAQGELAQKTGQSILTATKQNQTTQGQVEKTAPVVPANASLGILGALPAISGAVSLYKNKDDIGDFFSNLFKGNNNKNLVKTDTNTKDPATNNTEVAQNDSPTSSDAGGDYSAESGAHSGAGEAEAPELLDTSYSPIDFQGNYVTGADTGSANVADVSSSGDWGYNTSYGPGNTESQAAWEAQQQNAQELAWNNGDPGLFTNPDGSVVDALGNPVEAGDYGLSGNQLDYLNTLGNETGSTALGDSSSVASELSGGTGSTSLEGLNLADFASFDAGALGAEGGDLALGGAEIGGELGADALATEGGLDALDFLALLLL